MPRWARHGWFVWAVLMTGCSQPAPPAYPKWAKEVPPIGPSPTSDNAFDGYVLAAREAEAAAVLPANAERRSIDLSLRTSLRPFEKDLLATRMAGALQRFRRASEKDCEFRFSPKPPTQSDPNWTGWRLIRQTLVWQLESALTAKDFDRAVNLAVLATKAGFDLSSGGAANADIGLQFADEARRAMAPHIDELGAAQLGRLAAGMKRAIGALPQFAQIAENEKQNFLAGVDWVQEHYRNNTLDQVDEDLGSSVRDATTYLRDLRKDDRNRRPAYFQGFANEADSTADWYRSQSALPVEDRAKPEKMPLATERPWKRYAASLFATLKPIQSRYDATLARTRLMILTSQIYRQIKLTGAAPKSLDGFSPGLSIDPYSGKLFKYRVVGSDFFLYSVGLNLLDDQGETDSLYASPDLTLETKAG